MTTFDDDPGVVEKSRTRRKREATALQDLGEALIKLDAGQLARIPLPDVLREAVEAARHIRSRSAARRQRQYIGKLMREIDADAIAVAVNAAHGQSAADAARLREVELWRDRLIETGDTALAELVHAHPGVDSTHVRRLLRAAVREREAGDAPKSARLLFRYLRSVLVPD